MNLRALGCVGLGEKAEGKKSVVGNDCRGEIAETSGWQGADRGLSPGKGSLRRGIWFGR